MTKPRTRKLAIPRGLVVCLFGLLSLLSPVWAQQEVTLSGSVTDQAGQPLPGVPISADDVLVRCCPGFTSTRNDGSFQLNVAPGIYVITARPSSPLNPTRLRVDAREGDITGLELEVSAYPAPFLRDVPPRASLIEISPPDEAGKAMVTGRPGTILPESSVVLVNLETGHLATIQAGGDGSFSPHRSPIWK